MAKTTELEAVNEILMMAGITEVPDISASTLSNVDEANQALNILRRKSREIQSAGLHCNSEVRVTLSPNGSDEIDVPANVLQIDISDSRYPDVCFRADKLYNITEHSFTVFTNDVEVDVVYQLDYEDLPEHVRRRVNIEAGREFVLRYLRDTELYQMLGKEEQEARVAFFNAEADSSDYNMLDAWPSNELLNRSPQLSYRW
jgi:hypothetical protein